MGSEMCIRDSRDCAEAQPDQRTEPTRPIESQGMGRGSLWRRVLPLLPLSFFCFDELRWEVSVSQ